MQCRVGCGACCIAPSISSPIPGMPEGKPAGIPCVQLDANRHCRLFGQAGRPPVCEQFSATVMLCGDSHRHAMQALGLLEAMTS